jgi:hypothetical protein
MLGRGQDAITVVTEKQDENITEHHYLFRYMKRPATPDSGSLYYPYPTEDDHEGDGTIVTRFNGTQQQDLANLLTTPQSGLSGYNNFIASTVNGNQVIHSYSNLEKFKFFILSVYNHNEYGHETRTISPVISTEVIHVATNYFDVKKSGAKYIKDEQMSNDFVYIIPQYGNQLNGNTVCEYGRQSGVTYAKFDISDLDYLENYDFEIGRVNISSPDNDTADYIPPTPNIYYQFTTKERKIIENYSIKDPNNTDYKIVVITVVDKANSSAPAVCNVCRAIKVKISDFFTLENWMSVYLIDVVKTKHLATKDNSSMIYEFSDYVGCTTQEFNDFVSKQSNISEIHKIFTDLT